jgi:hypothetical protein
MLGALLVVGLNRALSNGRELKEEMDDAHAHERSDAA